MSTTPTSAPPAAPLSQPITRRSWLQRALLGSASAFGTVGAGSLLNLVSGTRSAHAADYRALVCVFLYGGNDGMNMVVPTDTTRYGQYAGVRAGLALPRGSLVPLNGSSFGLHPAMAALAPAWQAGQLAPVFNVGPLAARLTKAQYQSALPGALPDSLFSHADQQVLWETASASALTRTGWGGRAADALAPGHPVISVAGNGRFGVSALQAPLVLPAPGKSFGVAGFGPSDLQWAPNVARKQALDALYAQAAADALGNDIASAYAKQQRDAFEVSGRLGALVQTLPGGTGASSTLTNAFAPVTANGQLTTDTAAQLYQIAKLIEGNATVQGNRQIFFVQLGGFDTHGGQVKTGDATSGTHAALLKQLADALAAFNNAMNAIGLGPQVTTFTQSDFGRTFLPNNSLGTDHAWGNHHLVMGGAVRGGATYGTYPSLVLGGADDTGTAVWEQQGRWIPTSSVDQYAATLLKWFGATDGQLDSVLPNLAAFGNARSLGFV